MNSGGSDEYEDKPDADDDGHKLSKSNIGIGSFPACTSDLSS